MSFYFMEGYSVNRMGVQRLDRRERMAAETRRDILEAARRLFAARGYAATSVGDIAQEAGVAVQTIYSRLGSKRGMLMALVDLIEEESGRAEAAERVFAAQAPEAVLRASVQLTARCLSLKTGTERPVRWKTFVTSSKKRRRG